LPFGFPGGVECAPLPETSDPWPLNFLLGFSSEVFPLFKDGGGVSGCCNNLIFDIFINQLYKYCPKKEYYTAQTSECNYYPENDSSAIQNFF
jgi:hypothetical protein